MGDFEIVYPLPEERWAELRELRLMAVKESPQAFLDNEMETEGKSQENWLEWIKNTYFIEHQGKLVGMASLVRKDKEKENHIADIFSVYVRPEYRGKGLARKLLEEIIEKARSQGIKKIKLGVVGTQREAIALYRSLGFEEIGISKKEVRVGGKFYDEILMEMML